MNTPKLLKVIVIVFAIIIVVLLGILIFVKPVQGPTAAVSPDGRVVVSSPLPDALIISPVHIAGTVTGGGWFFEASFPVKILDGDGTVLGQGPVQAESDWMATGTVPFNANISFSAPHSATGIIVFAKDNPSGLPANGLEFGVPVRFK